MFHNFYALPNAPNGVSGLIPEKKERIAVPPRAKRYSDLFHVGSYFKDGDAGRLTSLFKSKDPKHHLEALRRVSRMSKTITRAQTGQINLSDTGNVVGGEDHYKTIGLDTTLKRHTREIDETWMRLVSVLDRSGDQRFWFKLSDLYERARLGFIEVGENLSLGHVELDQKTYRHYLYGGGIQAFQLWIQRTPQYEIADQISAILREDNNLKADMAWSMLTDNTTHAAFKGVQTDGVSMATIPFNSTHSTDIGKDIQTVNDGIQSIQDSFRQTPLPFETTHQTDEPVPTTFALMFNNQTARNVERVQAMLQAQPFAPNTTYAIDVQLIANVVPVGSYKVPAGMWYLAAPDEFNQISVWDSLRIYQKTDSLIGGVPIMHPAQGVMAAVRGVTNRIRKIALS